MVFTWSSASSSCVLVWNLLKSFWNNHYSERSTFEVIIIKKELLNYRYKKSTLEISIIPHLPKRERPSVSEEWMKTSWRYLKCCSSSTHTSAYIMQYVCGAVRCSAVIIKPQRYFLEFMTIASLLDENRGALCGGRTRGYSGKENIIGGMAPVL